MSNDRSPRDVCSITIGIRGLIDSPRFRGSTISSRPAGFSLSGVQIASRAACCSGSIGFTSAASRSSAARRRRSSRSASWWPCAQMSSIIASASSPDASACSRISSLTSSSETVIPALSATRLERELAGDRLRRLGADLAREHLGRLAGRLEVGLGRDPAVRERADEAVQAARGPALSTSGPAPCTFEARTSSSTAAARNARLDPLLERGADPALDVAAQLVERVELARRARELVVDLRQHLLVDVLDGDVDGCLGAVGELVARPCASRRPTRRRAPARSRRRDVRCRARPRCRTGPRRFASARSTTSVSPSCAGRSSAGRELGDRASQRVELRLDELLGDLGLRRAAPRASSSRRSRASAAPRRSR